MLAKVTEISGINKAKMLNFRGFGRKSKVGWNELIDVGW
jgi:hypothetical protein